MRLPTLLIDDLVRITDEDDDWHGAVGQLVNVTNGALYYLNMGYGDTVFGPFGRNQLTKIIQCGWFARCLNEATDVRPHPALGDVPVCDRCARFVGPT